MTNDEKLILQLALVAFEEVMNEVIDDYFDDHIVTDGGAGLSGIISRAMSARCRELEAGAEDNVLAQWRNKVPLH